MALIPIDRIVNTVLLWFQTETPTFNTIIDQFYQGKQMSFFPGLQKTIGESSLPSIEVGISSDEPSWEYPRVQGDNPSLEIHLTTSNKIISQAQIMESRLASLMVRILCYPPHIRGRIEGTNAWFTDSFPGAVSYGSAGYSWDIRVTKIPWKGKILEMIGDTMFPIPFQEGSDHFPI